MERSIQYGAKQAVENCTRVKPGEKVVIITDYVTQHIGHEIRDAAERITPGNVHTFNMDEYGARPEDGTNPLAFPAELARVFADADVSFYAAAGKKGELQSFRKPMIKAVETNERLRHAHMPGITDELMCTGMSVDYAKVQEVSAKIAAIVRQARYISVTSPAGTDFTAEFSPSYRWKISDGVIKPEDWSNLPDGEVFTCAYKVPKGIIVVDGILGDYLSKMFGVITETPVTLEIEKDRVKKISCDDDRILKELQQYTTQDENANRIGEFAIGTNIGLVRLVGNLLQDEKFPGVHVALGHGYPEKTGSDWNSNAHLDAVLKNVTINVESNVIMRDGKFTFL